jgi:hypothetical protein
MFKRRNSRTYKKRTIKISNLSVFHSRTISFDSSEEIWKENVKKRAEGMIQNLENSKKKKNVTLDWI